MSLHCQFGPPGQLLSGIFRLSSLSILCLLQRNKDNKPNKSTIQQSIKTNLLHPNSTRDSNHNNNNNNNKVCFVLIRYQLTESVFSPNRTTNNNIHSFIHSFIMSILAYNGAAMIAMAGKDCVGIAADRRLGVQLQTIACDFQKVFQAQLY